MSLDNKKNIIHKGEDIMDDRLTQAMNEAAESPIEIALQDIKKYLVFLNIDRAAIDEKAEILLKKVERFVSAKYQEELNWFLAGDYKTSFSEVGKALSDYMGFHTGNFFEALIAVAIIER